MFKNKLLIVTAFLLSLGLFSCYGHKELSLSNDVFLSHQIWQENYDKYVYLVHDDNSVYTLKNVSLERDSATGDVSAIIGTAADWVQDTTIQKSKKELKKEVQKEVHLYLTESDDREIEDGGGVEINKRDIQKVRMQGRKRNGLLAIIFGVIGAVVGLFLSLIVITLLLLLGGGSGGSDSNSEPTCYVATMVYGSTEAPEVMALRRFRDQYLKPHKIGRTCIKWYYANSPKFVEKHKSNTKINTAIRFALNQFVKLLK